MLEEVDVISSVSGGSFTALAYGLWGEDVFDGHFEQRFLRHNIQRDLVLMGVNPLNLITGANKSELAARYYDKHIFKHATYGDMLARGLRPVINVNAADMARQEQFQFVQYDFDLMGSDLSKLPVAWAAASSSAVPILLDPLRFKYHHGEAMDAAVRAQMSTETTRIRPSYQLWCLDLIDRAAYERSGTIEVDEREHKYMYLLDGGIVDNLGITPFFAAVRDGPARRLLDAGEIDHLVVIMVDAGTAPPNNIESSPATPGGLLSISKTATSGIHTNTWLLKTFVKHLFLEAYPTTRRAYELCAPGQVRDIDREFVIDLYAADIHFASLQDYDERQRFLTLPTSFALDDEDVDALIAVGQKLVKDNPEIRRLLRNLGS
jgi:NTE family protein